MPYSIIKTFNSPNEFLEWATKAPTPWRGKLSSREFRSDDWAGTSNFDQAYQLAKYGWEDGLKRLQKYMDIAELIIPVQKTKVWHYSAAGYYPNSGRASAGDPFNMAAPRREELKQKPIIPIRTNISANADVSSDRIMQWGAAICSYVNALEASGFSVELETVSDTYGGSDAPKISFQFPIKKAGESLSLISTVFWWAHPAALRRIEFSAMERLDIEQWYNPGYGKAGTWTKASAGTLDLSIRDACYTIEESIYAIRKKHQDMLDNTKRADVNLPRLDRV